MFTFLDLLVVVFLVVAALGLLSVCLMFLTRNRVIQRICIYVAAALGLFAGYASVETFGSLFPGQMMVGVALALVGVAAVVLERMSKGNEKMFNLARILAAVSAVLGIVNAFLI